MTMRKEKNLRTYGRHKNVVIVSDVWLSDSDKKQDGVFGTSSDDSSHQTSIFQSSSSSENGALSLNSTGNSEYSLFSSKPCKLQSRTRKVKQTGDKENEHPQRQTRKQESNKATKEKPKHKKQIFSISSSSENSFGSEKKSPARALRDRNQKIDYNESANQNKQLRGTTAKRKRPVRTCNNSKTNKESSVNFSDFDSYSLLISDSPPVDVLKVNDKLLSMETSTPVGKRTRCKGVVEERMKVTDISYIELVTSPGVESSFQGVETPESAHSQSLFNTPSVSSSNCSENVSNWSKQTGESVNGLNNHLDAASVKLKRLTESFISSAVAGSTRSHRTNQRDSQSHRLNNSESLFSSPDGNLEKNVSLLTKHLKQVRCGQLYNDSITEEASNLSENDNSGEESDENSDSEEDNDKSDDDDNTNDDDSSAFRYGDLSAIDEDEEANEVESTGDDKTNDDSSAFRDDNLRTIDEDEEANEVESDEDDDASIHSKSGTSSEIGSDSEQENGLSKKVTRNLKKSPKTNLQKLSESLLMNHVNRRRTTKSVKTNQDDSEIDDLVDCLENSNIDSSDSNCTLYMINDDGSVQSRKSQSVDLSLQEEKDFGAEGSESDKESKDESKLVYHTAQSSNMSRNSDYHTAEEQDGDDDGGTDEEEKQMEQVPFTPEKKKYSLLGKFQHLQNSFSELLSPKRKKDSMVPLSAQARVLVLCDQTEAVTFTTALSRKMILKCKKIGEGVYGEVFRSYNNDGEAVAIKIIPIEGDFEVNDEQQKKFSEILPEVVIAKELSNLRDAKSSMTSSFCKVNNASCVKGKYPAELIREWDVFHKNKHSENDKPDVFPKKQLYIVFEFADCGTDLESYKFDTIQQAKSVLSQVAYALAVAEETLQFEHRDLHWGNVLVRSTEKENIHCRLLGKPVCVPSLGVEASVIDFTMSRLTKDGCTVYINIPDDDTLFQGEGDYQFDIYREMKKENKGNWEKFCPHTNVLWLHYLADKLVYATRYKDQSSRQEREVLRQFRQFMSTMLQYRSACDMVVDSLFLNS